MIVHWGFRAWGCKWRGRSWSPPPPLTAPRSWRSSRRRWRTSGQRSSSRRVCRLDLLGHFHDISFLPRTRVPRAVEQPVHDEGRADGGEEAGETVPGPAATLHPGQVQDQGEFRLHIQPIDNHPIEIYDNPNHKIKSVWKFWPSVGLIIGFNRLNFQQLLS